MLPTKFKLFLPLILMIFNCYSCLDKPRDVRKKAREKVIEIKEKEIIDPELIEENLIGNWKISGETKGSNTGALGHFNGEIEFRDSNYYSVIGSFTVMAGQQLRLIVACDAKGKWTENENEEFDFDYDYKGKCNCTLNTFNEGSLPTEERKKMSEWKSDFDLCEDGIYLFPKDYESGDSSVTKDEYKVYKDRIILRGQNYSLGIESEIRLDRMK